MEEQDGQEFLPVLAWYCQHCSKTEQERLKLPSIASARQFRKQFGWIEERYLKHAESEGVPVKRRWTAEDEFPNGRLLITDLGNDRSQTQIVKPPYDRVLKSNQHWKDEEDE